MPSVRGLTFETQRLDRLIARMPEEAERFTELLAREAEREAIVRTVRVETGTMRRGWHAVRLERLLWRVGTSVPYAVFHEFGTSRLSATPMLGPAIEAARRMMPSLAKRLFKP